MPKPNHWVVRYVVKPVENDLYGAKLIRYREYHGSLKDWTTYTKKQEGCVNCPKCHGLMNIANLAELLNGKNHEAECSHINCRAILRLF